MFKWRRVAAALALCAVLAAAVETHNKKLSTDQQILHALRRLTFGPRPGDIEHVRGMGIKKWLDLQLHPERIEENPALGTKLKPLDTLSLSPAEMAREYPPPQLIRAAAEGRIALPADPGQRARLEQLIERYRQRREGQPPVMARNLGPKLARAASTEERRKMIYSAAPVQVVAHDLVEAKLLRAIYSERQLEEVLADFWFNHFNVYLDKGADRYLVTSYERDAIRPHVLGKFKDLLRATAEHPAMLFYLDNWQSVDPKAAERIAAIRRRPGLRMLRGLNENYARELLELHTLGVDGGYTQKDIVEVARCFTGWTIRDPRRGGGFEFNGRLHDPDEKTVLGIRIPAGGGQEDGLKVLDILARHPSTARFISRKLAQRFVSDQPPPALVGHMAKRFRETDGDIREVMTAMLHSKEFGSESAWRAKVKSPLEMVAGAVRALGADVNSTLALARMIAEMGQPLYRKPEPTGYPNTGEGWVDSAALLARMNFALGLAANRFPGVRVDFTRLQQYGDAAQLARSILGEAPSKATLESIEKALAAPGAVNPRFRAARPVLTAGLVLGSPEFQRR